MGSDATDRGKDASASFTPTTNAMAAHSTAVSSICCITIPPNMPLMSTMHTSKMSSSSSDELLATSTPSQNM